MTDTSAAQPAVSGAKGIYPFTFREYGVFGVAVLLLIASVLPLGSPLGNFGIYLTVWSIGFAGFLFALMPLVIGALLALRRLVPSVHWRVGSLSVDQFASVGFIVVAALYCALMLSLPSAGSVLGFLFALVGIALTTAAKFIPFFAVEFTERKETAAHVTARSQVLPLAKPDLTAPAPAPTSAQNTAPSTQPFWVLSPEERDVVDDKGATVFTIDQSAWVAAIEDRGDELVIRSEDGRTGVLKDLTDISRA